MATQSSLAAGAAKRVVVCGGGVIGVCTAYFLAQKGAAVTIIEKSSIACAASGKAGGFLALDWCDGGPLGDLARASFRLHRSLSDVLDGPRSYGYRPLTTLSLAISAGAGGAGSAAPSWVDGAAAGTPRTIGTPATTAQVHPQLFTRALLAAASGGVEVVIGEVESVEVVGGRAVGVVIKGGGGKLIEADAVVLALGPWSSRSPLVSSLFAVSGMKAHSIVLRPRDPAAITPHALFLSYQPSPGAKLLDPEIYPRPTGFYFKFPKTTKNEKKHDSDLEYPSESEDDAPEKHKETTKRDYERIKECTSTKSSKGNKNNRRKNYDSSPPTTSPKDTSENTDHMPLNKKNRIEETKQSEPNEATPIFKEVFENSDTVDVL